MQVLSLELTLLLMLLMYTVFTIIFRKSGFESRISLKKLQVIVLSKRSKVADKVMDAK